MEPTRNKRWPWFVGIALVAVGTAAFYFKDKLLPSKAPQNTSMPAMAMPSAPVEATAQPQQVDVVIPASDLDRMHLKFAKVTTGAVSAEVRVPGTVQPNAYKQVRVTPLVGGLVTQVSADLGQPVKLGQPLAQIFSRDLAEAQTSYVAISAELEAEHKKLVRTQELVRLGAASRQELEEVEANHQVHAAHQEEARQRLLLLGVEEEQVGKQGRSNIVTLSPLDGIVTARGVNVGQVVTSGHDLFTITDLASVWIEANLLENDFGAVHVGSRAVMTTPAFPGRQYRGSVDYIDPQVDPQTRTAKVRVVVANPGLALRLGMYVDVLFTSATSAGVPIVPKQAIQSIGPTTVVYVQVDGEPGHFLQKIVKTGAEVSAGFQVLDGLKAGDSVVTEGSFLLRAEAIRQHP